jgi:hypothetical protein
VGLGPRRFADGTGKDCFLFFLFSPISRPSSLLFPARDGIKKYNKLILMSVMGGHAALLSNCRRPLA